MEEVAAMKKEKQLLRNEAHSNLSKHPDPSQFLVETQGRSASKDAKRSGILCAALGFLVVFVSAGMPGHRFWRWIGVPLLVLFALAFAALLFSGAIAVSNWFSRKNQ